MDSLQPQVSAPTNEDRLLNDAFSPRRVFITGLAASALLVILQVGLFSLAAKDWQRTILNDGVAGLGTLGGFLGLGYGAYWTARRSPRSKTAWVLMAAGGLFLCLGSVLHFILEALLGQVASPSVADGFVLAGYPLLLAGIVKFPSERLSFRELFKLGVDFAIIIATTAFIFGVVVIRPLLAAGIDDFRAIAVALAYPIGDMILIWVVVILAMRPVPGQPKQPIWCLLAAGITVATGDSLATGIQAQAIYPSANWLYVFYLVSPLALMLSGLLQAQLVTRTSAPATASSYGEETRISNRIQLSVPYILLGVTYLLLWKVGLEPPVLNRSLVFGWEALIIALVILRQVITLLENNRLTRALNRLNGELEHRVSIRTIELVAANNALRQEMDQRSRTERTLHEREEKLAHTATHDALTDLPNRLLLLEQLTQDLARLHEQPVYRFALLFLDIDGFKIVNDSLGHPAGDRLLVDIAARLQGSLPCGDCLARLGGDEFVVLLEELLPDADPRRKAEALLDELARPFEVAGHRIFLTASVGVVVGDGSYQESSELLRDAELAMYEAKAQGKARCVAFDPRLRAYALDRLVLGSDLRAALDRNQFCLEYQPIRSLETGAVTGLEALIRWQHPERGMMAPGDFLPVAEASGMIFPMTRWVLREACAQVRAWQMQFPIHRDLSIHVNLSPKLFSNPKLPQLVAEALAESSLAPASLHLEITEAVFAEKSQDVQGILTAWRASGIGVQMDDFGMEFSSLSYLRQFPIDTLKIAQTFIRRIRRAGGQAEIVRRIIALARDLRLKVVAGGVESAEEVAFLEELGCHAIQGFFVSGPLDAQSAAIFLAAEALGGPARQAGAQPRG